MTFSTVCFRLKGSDEANERIFNAVNASGKYYISHTALNDQYVLRIAIGNLGTTWVDVEGCWKMIQEVSSQ